MPGTNNRGTLPCRRHEPGVRFTDRARNARARTIRKRHRHGQVFTPYHVSKEAAATLDLKANATGTIHILDAGAGDGQLTLATLDRIGREPEATRPRQIYLTAVEADTELADANEKNLNDIETWCKERHMNVRAAVVREDFLSPRRWRCRSVNVNAHIPIDTCIMNSRTGDAQRRPGDPNDPTRRRGNEREPVLQHSAKSDGGTFKPADRSPRSRPGASRTAAPSRSSADVSRPTSTSTASTSGRTAEPCTGSRT